MDHPIKIKDIAAHAGVSAGTVDRVLHNRGDVSQKTREKVLKIIDELGYKTNIIAKTLALKKKIVFATLIPAEDSYSNYWQKPLTGFQKAEKEFSKYRIKINNYLFDINNKNSFIEKSLHLIGDAPDAVVIAPIFKKEATIFINKLKEKKIPFIFLDTNLDDEKESIGYIGHDSFQSGKVAAKLIDKRIKSDDNILLINLSANTKEQNHLSKRSEGFKVYFSKKNRIGTLFEIDINNLSNSFIKNKMDYVFSSVSNLKAIFVTSSKAYLIAAYLYKNKLQHQVVLTGYDLIDRNITYLNNDTIDYLISQNPIKQGFDSIEILFRSVVMKNQIKKNTYLPIDIIIKENVMYY